MEKKTGMDSLNWSDAWRKKKKVSLPLQARGTSSVSILLGNTTINGDNEPRGKMRTAMLEEIKHLGRGGRKKYLK